MSSRHQPDAPAIPRRVEAPPRPHAEPASLSYEEAEHILEQLARLSENHDGVQVQSPESSAPAPQTSSHAEARFRTLIEQIPAITFLAEFDASGNELYVSPQIEAILGFSQQEWLENPILWYSRLHPDDRARWQEEFARTCACGDHFCAEYRFLARDGSVVWVHGEARVVRDAAGHPLFLQGVAFDITQRKLAETALRQSHEELEKKVQQRTAELEQANRALRAEISERRKTQQQLLATLEERETLLKEIHHRVKNNLQLIVSLLKLQAQHVDDPQALNLLRESQNRVRLMALLHENLYRAGDLGRISVRRYVEDLTAHLVRSFTAQAATVRLNVRVADVWFDLDTAIPCGLIINELVTNSLKYAFPGSTPGHIDVELHAAEAGAFTLVVADDGIGLPTDVDQRTSSSLGLQLVNMLSNQLGGRVERLDRRPGTRFVIPFTLASAAQKG